MNQMHDEIPQEQFDALLRAGLKALPTPDPITDLPERAITLARSKCPAPRIGRARHERLKHARLLTLSTVLALFVVAGIWVVGAWFIITNATLFPTSSFAANAASVAQTDDLGFTIAILAAIAVTLGLLATSFLDLIDSRETAAQTQMCI